MQPYGFDGVDPASDHNTALSGTPRICLFALYIIIFGIFGQVSAVQAEKLQVVVTFPVLSDLVDGLMGADAELFSMAGWRENVHSYQNSPSDLMQLRKAELFVKTGLDIDAWADSLELNPSTAVVNISSDIKLSEQPDGNDSGHPNPHIWLNPVNMIAMANALAPVLIRLRPSMEKVINRRRSDYIGKLELLDKETGEALSGVAGANLITYHPAWSYFAKRYGLNIVDTILAQEGSEPSIVKIAGLIRTIRRKKVRFIITEPTVSSKLADMLAEETGVGIVTLALIPGSVDGAETYLEMMKLNRERLLKALRQ